MESEIQGNTFYCWIFIAVFCPMFSGVTLLDFILILADIKQQNMTFSMINQVIYYLN